MSAADTLTAPSAGATRPRAAATATGAAWYRGMHTVSCASRTEHELARSTGVVQATVNLTTEEATVRYRPEAADVAELERAVAHAGCKLRPVPVEGDDAIDRVMRGGAMQRNVAPGPTRPGRSMNGPAMGHTGASSP